MKVQWHVSPKGLSALSVFMLTAALARRANAADSDAGVREAASHFQRGVGLYREADYRGALVEFHRASELVPAPVTFYNIGETEFQLREYAEALAAFERYLAESAPDERHRAEVEASAGVLRTRIGLLLVTTVPAAADITVDDRPVGKTPFEKPLRVSIGHHRVVASLAGWPAVERYVDVAAEDNVSVQVSLAAPDPAAPESPGSASLAPRHVDGSSRRLSPLRVAGWVTAGTFAAGGVAFALLARARASDLQDARVQYPVTRETLDHDGAVTTTYAVLADSLFAAAAVIGTITLFSTLSSSSSARVTVGVSSLRFDTTF